MRLYEKLCGSGRAETTCIGDVHSRIFCATGEFRDPQPGEYFLDSTGTSVVGPTLNNGWGNRIILKPAVGAPPRREACHGIRAAIDNITDSLIAIKDQLRKIDDS